MFITLNGNQYELSAGTGVRRSPLIEWPDNTRLDGQQRRKDRRFTSSLVIDSWAAGLGRQEVNVATASDISSIWDAENVDTRIDGQIVLSPAFNTVTIVPSRGDLEIPFSFDADLYLTESQRAGTLGYAYQFSPPFTFGSHRIIAIAPGAVIGSIRAVRAFGGQLAVALGGSYLHDIGGGTFSQFIMGVSTLGAIVTTEIAAFAVHSAKVDRLSHFGDLGGTLHLLEYDGTEKDANFIIGNQAITQGALRERKNANVGTFLAPLVTDGLTMFANLPEGVYDFDITPAIVVDTSRAQDKNNSQVMFQGRLYFKNKKSLIQWDGSNPIGVGYDLRDGLKGEKMGEITAMASSWNRIFAAVQGATFSHILTLDTNKVWQYYTRIPTAGLWVRELFLSDAPDAIDRLWVMFGNHPFPGYYLNPMVNPLQAATYSYVPTGHFTYPIYGGDLPEENGAFFDIAQTGDGMGGSNIITILYGINGDNPVTTLGVIATTNLSITFASPAGIEAHRLQPDFVLGGANSGTSPIFRQAIGHYLKQPEQREIYDFEIDLKETSRLFVREIEAIIGSLNFDRESKTLLPFQYGQIATRSVLALNMPFDEDVEEQDFMQGERDGKVRLRLAEIL